MFLFNTLRKSIVGVSNRGKLLNSPIFHSVRPLSSKHAIFNLNLFKSPSDINRCPPLMIGLVNKLCDEFTTMVTSKDSVYKLDNISDVLCSVLDMLEAIRHTHEDPEWVKAAATASDDLTVLLNRLNVDPNIYIAIKAVCSNENILSTLTAEERRVALNFLYEFEDHGVNQSDKAREVIFDMTNKISQVANNVFSLVGTPSAPLVITGDDVTKLQSSLSKMNSSLPISYDYTGKGLTITIEDQYGLIPYLAQWSDLPSVRREALNKMTSNAAEHAHMIDNYTALRQNLARRIGFPSSAHRELNAQSSKLPEIIQFMKSLNQSLLPAAATAAAMLILAKRQTIHPKSYPYSQSYEAATALAEMRELKSKEQCNSLPLSDESLLVESNDIPLNLATAMRRAIMVEYDIGLEPWDVSHYTNAVQSLSTAHSQSSPSEYLSLANVLRGISLVCLETFGIHFESADFNSCVWAGKEDGWKSFLPGDRDPAQLYRYVLRCPKKGILGYVYLDFFARPGKYPGSALFTLRSSKLRVLQDERAVEDVMCPEEVSFARSILENNPSEMKEFPGSNIISALPIHSRRPGTVLLSTNFALSSRSLSRSERLEFTSVTPEAMRDLFHEMGHVLHALCSTTAFQTVAGTRVCREISEVPSHLFEYFSRDYRVVKKFAFHRTTSKPMPQGLWTAALRHDRFFDPVRIGSTLHWSAYCLATVATEEVWKELSEAPGTESSPGTFSFQNVITVNQARKMLREMGVFETAEKRFLKLLNLDRTNGTSLEKVVEDSIDFSKVLSEIDPQSFVVPLADDMNVSRVLQPAPENNLGIPNLPNAADIHMTLLKQGSLMPFLNNDSTNVTLSHQISYGASYYCYLYAIVLSSDIWNTLFAKDPFCKEAGAKFRTSFLEKGGSVAPHDIMFAILGREPNARSLIHELGIKE